MTVRNVQSLPLKGCFNTVFPVYSNSKSAVSILNILLLKMEMAESHKGRLGLARHSWALFYK